MFPAFVFANLVGGCANDPRFGKFVFCCGKYVADVEGPIDKSAGIMLGGGTVGLDHRGIYPLSVQYHPTRC